MPTKLEYVIELVKKGDLQGAVRELQSVDSQAARTGGTVEASGRKMVETFKAVAGAMVIRELVQFGASAVREFEQAEQAAAKLDGTLRASGQYTPRYSAELQQLAASLQRVSRFGDEAVLNVESQLVAFGAARQDIPRLTETVMDLAEGMGTDLPAAAMLVGKALQGEFGALSRYGINLDETATRAQKLEQALAQIEQRFGGLARAAGDTATGGLVKLKNEIGDLKEVVGDFVLTGLQPMVDLLHQMAVPPSLGGWQQRSGGVADLDAQNRKLRAQLQDEAIQAAGAGRIKWQEAQKMIAAMDRAFVSSTVEAPKRSALDRLKWLPFGLTGVAADIATEPSGPTTLVNVEQQRAALNAAMAQLHPDIARSEPAELERIKAVTEEQKAARQELINLQQELTLATLTGIDHEKLAASQAAQEREQQIRKLIDMSGLSDAEKAAKQTEINALLGEAFDTQVKEIDLKELAAQLAEAEKADREEKANQARLEQVIEQGILELNREEARELERQVRAMNERAQLAAQGESVLQQNRFESAEMRGDTAPRIQAEFAQRQRAIENYYNFQMEKAGENYQLLAELEGEKTQAIQENMELEKLQIFENSMMFRDVLAPAAHQFSGSFAHELVNGIRTGRLEMGKFAADFLAQVAEMIMRVLILKMIMAAINGITGGVQGVKGGYDVPAAGITPNLAADGIMTEITGPTYDSRFNVLAGEAGPEIMTVLAQPRRMSIGGVASVIGRVGSDTLMVSRYADLAPRLAANGLFAGAPGTGGAAGSGINGFAVIEVRPAPGALAEVKEQAIEGAHLKVLNDLQEDTPMSNAVKSLSK